LREQPVNHNAASDYPGAGDRTRRSGGPPLIDGSAELAARRVSPLISLIVVMSLSLAIWAAIWAMFRSLLWG